MNRGRVAVQRLPCLRRCRCGRSLRRDHREARACRYRDLPPSRCAARLPVKAGSRTEGAPRPFAGLKRRDMAAPPKRAGVTLSGPGSFGSLSSIDQSTRLADIPPRRSPRGDNVDETRRTATIPQHISQEGNERSTNADSAAASPERAVKTAPPDGRGRGNVRLSGDLWAC